MAVGKDENSPSTYHCHKVFLVVVWASKSSGPRLEHHGSFECCQDLVVSCDVPSADAINLTSNTHTFVHSFIVSPEFR